MKFFGTDGIRGPYGGDLLNDRLVQSLAAAWADWMSEKKGRSLRLVVGRDPRDSGTQIKKALLEGLAVKGEVTVMDLGMVPTPVVAWCVRNLEADGGIMITASHNPPQDNGLKVFGRGGLKLSLEEENAFEQRIENFLNQGELSKEGNLNVRDYPQGLQAYRDSMLKHAPGVLEGLRVVLDCAHGATGAVSPDVLRAWGLDVILMGEIPSGKKINDQCGSEYPQFLGGKVRASNAALGFAHDGDGDRVLLCDGEGNIVPGEVVMAQVAKKLWQKGGEKILVTTVQSNLGLDAFIEKAGGTVLRTDVGDRNVAFEIEKRGALIGGESSGHYIFKEQSLCGDGLFAIGEILKTLGKDGNLSEWVKAVPLFPQVQKNLKIKEKKPLDTLTHLMGLKNEWEEKLSGNGRILMRYSGTEPKLRLLTEGKDLPLAQEVMDSLEAQVRKDLEVLDA